MKWHDRIKARPATIRRQAERIVERDSDWLIHALYCDACDVRELALWLLGVAGLTEDELYTIQWAKLMEAVRSGGV